MQPATTMTTEARKTDAFDPQAPYFGPDHLRYETFGHFLADRPEESVRNDTIRGLQSLGRSEAFIAIFADEYDFQRLQEQGHVRACDLALELAHGGSGG